MATAHGASAQSNIPAGDDSGYTGYLIKLTVISTLGGLLFGYDTGVISGALPFLKEDLQLSSVQEASVVSSLLFPGAAAGALVGGKLADVLGRKKSLLVCAALFFVGALACSLAPTVAVMVVARIILGNRRGSNANRQAHSSPSFRSAAGARRSSSAHTSSEPPTPMKIRADGTASALRAIHRSCFGAPNPTRTIAGEPAVTARVRSGSSSAGSTTSSPARSSGSTSRCCKRSWNTTSCRSSRPSASTGPGRRTG